jgi:Fe-S-cluster containining protein
LADHDPAELLSRMLASGTWVLDRHLGLPQTPATAGMANRMELVTWYPRPATRQERRRRTMAGLQETGECVFLERDGCTLSFQERPLLCRSLEPGSEECHSSWSRADAALAWWPLQHVVLQAIAGCRRRNPDLEWPAERPAQL